MRLLKDKLLVSIILASAFIGVPGAMAKPLMDIELLEGTIEAVRVPNVSMVMVKDSNIVTAKLSPSSFRLVITGHKLGKTQIICRKQDDTTTRISVTVLPRYWDTLKNLLRDSPQIRVSISGEKVLLTGRMINSDTLENLAEARKLDPKRIISKVKLYGSGIAQNAELFLQENGFNEVKINIIGNIAYISGTTFDTRRRDLCLKLINSYFAPYKIQVNPSNLSLTSKKILMHVQFIQLDKRKIRNLGLQVDSPITWKMTIGDIARALGGSIGGLKDAVYGAQVTGIINALKQNQAAKTLYETALSTQSGEKAEFQQGGTLNVGVFSQYNTGLHEIEYGFIIKVKPTMIDENKVALDFLMELKIPKAKQNEDVGQLSDIDITKYLTTSKYTVKPGESIILSGFRNLTQQMDKSGIPLFSSIPLLGSLFGSTNNNNALKETVLMITIEWQHDQTNKNRNEFNKLKFRNVNPEAA
ncbi:MAG: type II and III secretion system protein [Lentisphaerae bacterium]|nr:type II and III secretion system protein [Lentisphaerota bacterium]MCP4099872.1 type II and III secretion system protein [Lentisphaerota bacterium]